MKKVLLNNDLLNDCNSIYFQIDKFTFIKFSANGNERDFISLFADCAKQLNYEGINHTSVLIPINIYNNIVVHIDNNPLYDLTDTVESVLAKVGLGINNLMVYIPDILKDVCSI
jgi:hypothetical protein